ncbi:hypothetical protein [Oceanobacillus salinisoli]|uniref:hypothetical protein n=1 Tax=Oceanobacillus salinisoli TaxID=2678611 RepID=UPI0012E15316|nr:hypothetical protein [Oceanobacillus salinisoli]
MKYKKYLVAFLSIILLLAVGCTNQNFTSPMLFTGESENWTVAMVIEQEEVVGMDKLKARYKYNITYNKDVPEKYITKWVDGEEVSLTYYIEGPDENIENSHQQPIFYSNSDYWFTGVDNNSFLEPYTENDTLDVVINFDGAKETITLKFDKGRTKDLKGIERDVIENSLVGPIEIK